MAFSSSICNRSHEFQLAKLMRALIDDHINAGDFANVYISEWKVARDCPTHNYPIEAVFDRAFTAADCYAPPDVFHKSVADINEAQLKKEIAEILREIEGLDVLPPSGKE